MDVQPAPRMRMSMLSGWEEVAGMGFRGGEGVTGQGLRDVGGEKVDIVGYGVRGEEAVVLAVEEFYEISSL